MVWSKIKSFFGTGAGRWLALVLLALVLFGGGYGVGRWAQPAKIVEKTVTVEKVVEKTTEKTEDHTQVNASHDTSDDKKIHRVTVEVKKPDGTTTTTKTEDISSDKDTHDKSVTTEVKYVDRVVEKWQDKIVTKEVEKLAQPRWDVYAGVGVDVLHYLGQPQHGVPNMQGVVVQVGGDVRVGGPIWLGVFANTESVVGLNLRLSM